MRTLRTAAVVAGIGTRKKGTSKKTGNAFDFVPVALTYQDPAFNGSAAITLNIPGADFDCACLSVGEVREVLMVEQNFRLDFAAFL